MKQKGQVFELKTRSHGGEAVWAYRYRIAGRDSRRLQRGGFKTEQAAREALERAERQAKQEESGSPLTDSNRRPPLYEEGPCVNWSGCASPSHGGRCSGGWRVVLISLSPPRGEDKADWSSLRWRSSLRTVRRPGGRWRLWERRVRRG